MLKTLSILVTINWGPSFFTIASAAGWLRRLDLDLTDAWYNCEL